MIAINPVLPPFLVITLLLMAGAFLLWKESKRNLRLYWFRIAAQVLLLSALAAIFFRPSCKTSVTLSTMLLSENYNENQADSLAGKNPGIKIIRTPGAKHYSNAEVITSYNALINYNDNIRFVLGDGVPPYAAEFISNDHLNFLPAHYPSGIIQVHVPEEVLVNRRNKVEGILHNVSGNSVLYLEGPGGKEDSVTVSDEKHFTFALHFFPKQSGEYIYQLILKEGSGRETKHALPLRIKKPEPLKILFIQHYPMFETQYLKTFLSRRHKLLLRYQLSQNTFRYEYLNHPSMRVDRLTSETLSAFDLLLIDSDALQGLSSSELTSLQQAVESGLGVFFLFNENPSGIRQLRSFLLFDFKKTTSDTVQFRMDAKMVVLPAWPVTTSSTPVYAIVKNKQRIISGYVYKGMGKAGFNLANETFSLYLKGDSLSYSQYWTSALEQIARRKANLYSIRLKNSFPIYPDEPVSVEITGVDESPTLFLDGLAVPVREDISIDGVWHATAWTGEPGWHELLIAEDSTSLKFFIHQQNEWSALATANKINTTKSIRSLKSVSDTTRTKDVDFKPVSPVVFYIIFLIAAGFMWVAPKL